MPIILHRFAEKSRGFIAKKYKFIASAGKQFRLRLALGKINWPDGWPVPAK
jgi:hypothetical protein